VCGIALSAHAGDDKADKAKEQESRPEDTLAALQSPACRPGSGYCGAYFTSELFGTGRKKMSAIEISQQLA